MEIPKHIAGLLCSAILSDTLMFRSPTCTPLDVEVAQRLAELAGIECREYAREMFTAGSDLALKTPKRFFTRISRDLNSGTRISESGRSPL